MIAKAAPKRRSGSGSFTALQQYLERTPDGQIRQDCVASWSHGVASHATAALEMERTVLASRYRGDDPVYHVVASFRPGESVDLEVAKQTEEALVRSVGAEHHQRFVAFHYDEDTDRYHLHIGINKVHPQTGKVLATWQDYAKLARASEWIEREHGFQVDRKVDWRKRVGERDFVFEMEAFEQSPHVSRGVDREIGGTLAARDARARAHYSWTEILRGEVVPVVAATLVDPNARWVDLHAALRPYGVHFEAAGSGFRIVGAEIGQHVKASSLGLDAKRLVEQIGPYQAPLDHLAFSDRCELVRASADAWTSWDVAHRDMAAADLAIRDLGGGRGQVVDLVGDRTAPLTSLGYSLFELEARLGAYTIAPALRAREERERERQQIGLSERAALLVAEPELILGPLMQTRSTWERADVEHAVGVKLGISKGEYPEQVAQTTESVLGHCLLVDAERGVYSTMQLRDEERALFVAANVLHASHVRMPLRGPGDELDVQQRAAFAHLSSERQLAIVTGVAGAGKSRLQRDLCAAYTQSGARVLGVAVSGEAARTLGEEAQIEAKTVAKLVWDLEHGQEQLGPKDVLFIDEAGTLGTEQARQLFSAAVEAGATVRLLGDASQHESVARGAVLRGLVDDFDTYDMEETRRAQAGWLREVAKDLRAARVAPALDALRSHGAVRAYATQEEAKAFLVRSYVAASEATVVEHGQTRAREALLLADSNDDMRAMNQDVQAAFVASGRLGQAEMYRTDFGDAVFHERDLVAIRAGKVCPGSESRWVNGDRARVEAHLGGGVLRLVRERDGAVDLWDTHEHGAIQLGYAMTSYRSQGKTVDDVFVLPAQGRRGTYVDVTRARETVMIAYGEDRVRDFGALMYQAQRDQGKTLVRDTERSVEQRQEQRAIQRRDVAIRKLEALEESREQTHGIAPTKVRPHEQPEQRLERLEAAKERADRTIHEREMEQARARDEHDRGFGLGR